MSPRARLVAPDPRGWPRGAHAPADLLASGVSEVHAFAVAFDGKKVWVKAAEPGRKKTAGRKKARAER